MAAEEAEWGGYDEYEFVDTPPYRLLCIICQLPSRKPYLTACCGSTICEACLEKTQGSTPDSEPITCPFCRSKNYEAIYNKQIEREIKSLFIYCTNKEKGCPWKGELNDIENRQHFEKGSVCQFEEEECSNVCGKMIQRRYMTIHLAKECPRRMIQCQYCHDTGEYESIEGQHKEVCPKLPLPCPNKCRKGRTVRREDMEAHITECPLEIIQCEYHSVGCNIKMARKDLEKHKKEKMEDHLRIMQAKCFEFEHKKEKMEDHLRIMQAKCFEFESKLYLEKHKKEKMEDHLRIMQAKCFEFESKLSAAETEAENKVAKLRELTTNLMQKLETTEQKLATIQDQFDEEYKKMQDTQEEQKRALKSVLNDFFEQAKIDQWILLLRFSASSDRICPVIVKVSEVEDKKIHKKEWHSDPFYTHDKGYKMCLFVIINGTDHCEGTHVSVYLYITKGSYDDDLKWPLVKTFGVRLLNQNMNEEHYKGHQIRFTHDTPSVISGKIRTKRSTHNRGLGHVDYIAYDDLKRVTCTHQYLKDDCIYFEIYCLPENA